MGEEIGKVTHYFTSIGVGVIELTGNLEKGDKIAIKGHTTDIEMEVESMEVDRKKIDKAGSGDSIGLKVRERIRPGDKIFKL